MGWKLGNTSLTLRQNVYHIKKIENKGMSDNSEKGEGVEKFLHYTLGESSKVKVETKQGQLISKCSFGVIVLTKIPMNFF